MTIAREICGILKDRSAAPQKAVTSANHPQANFPSGFYNV